ncbi:hypothetical protein BD289DRAFT_435869 [Coniella lustricola]|uniref:F-box domain-containing protein n=1 Tax=Coniella lustricola TaxID=2025994 RepID=A0A2T3A5S8_9PEZI|nr:hypothetical protein BD289DRAFT_435869 [Coniella lustricola]
MRLPVELQLKVLEYTDVVTPLNRVSWSAEDGCAAYRYEKYLCVAHHEGSPYSPNCHPRAHRDCTDMDACTKCPHVLPDSAQLQENRGIRACHLCTHYACQFMDCFRKSEPDGSDAPSFCMVEEAGYSANCQCWRPPTDLFLVSKEFACQAQRIWFSQNDFRVAGGLDFALSLRLEPSLVFMRNIFVVFEIHTLEDLQEAVRWRRGAEMLMDRGLLNPSFVEVSLIVTELQPVWTDLLWPNDYRDVSDMELYTNEDSIGIVRDVVNKVWPMRNSSRIKCLKANIILDELSARTTVTYSLRDQSRRNHALRFGQGPRIPPAFERQRIIHGLRLGELMEDGEGQGEMTEEFRIYFD